MRPALSRQKPATPRPARSRRSGVAIVEFALVMPLVLTLTIGAVEMGYQLTVASALDRATLRASRFGITGQQRATGAPAGMGCRSQSIAWLITSSSGNVLKPDRLNLTLASYGSASQMGGASSSGAGLGGQVVVYTATYTQPFLSLAWLHLGGGPAALTHTATVAVKNEAFDNATC